MAAEAWFYQLERSSLEAVLPDLLAKCLERGWRALVVASARPLLERLDVRLWTFSDASFLAHGLESDPSPHRQPVLLSTSGENLNGAKALVLVDEAEGPAIEGFERALVVFDGGEESALRRARERWSALKVAGASLAYWRQKEERGWERQA
ncbi:MAG: DNA polymerase III subunit chi [Caulobacteraceae bacterium]